MHRYRLLARPRTTSSDADPWSLARAGRADDLTRGVNPRRLLLAHLPIGHVERWIPILFALVYVAGFVAMLIVCAVGGDSVDDVLRRL